MDRHLRQHQKAHSDGLYLDSKKYIRDTIQLFEQIRAKIGYDMQLVHDVHERIAPADAVALAKGLEPFDLFFLEDPVPLEQLSWLRNLRQQTSIPIAQGELFNNPYEWRTVIAEQLIDFIRVHISQVGGITPARKLQIFAEQFGVRTAWHGPGGYVSVSPCSKYPHRPCGTEFRCSGMVRDRTAELCDSGIKGPHGALLDVFPGMPEYRKGYVYANDKPGLGVDIDETEAAKYPCENTVTTWTQTRGRDGALVTP